MQTKLLLRRALPALLTIAFCLPSMAWADHLVISRYFSGAWMQPDHESQGLVLHIAEGLEDSKVAVAHWFTFGIDLETAWYLAHGEVDGHEIHMTLFSASGIGFMETDLPGDELVEAVGTLSLSFDNCNQGTAFFDTPEEVIGSGEFRIRRLTSLYRSRCSGGISDDTPSDKRPEKLSVKLLPARDDVGGEGKAQFWERPDRSDFIVAVEGAPDGSYDLFVCGEDTDDDLLVVAGEGALQYRSPAIDAKLLLDFDPRECSIELHDEAGVALTSGDAVLAPHEKGPKEKDGGVEIGVDLTNTGVIPDAEGEAEYEAYEDEAEFEVEIEGVPAGLYPLFVGGEDQGQIEVVEDDGKFKGKLKFSDPERVDTELLDFDPRGEIVEVLQGDAVILEALFPTE
ncbi:MAG: hypothetical protein R3348_03110 [Xanthomonadales bacterium]|nr:hypothetical protein [Xanthomonadales bacterium]